LRHLKAPSNGHELPENRIESKNQSIIEEVIVISELKKIKTYNTYIMLKPIHSLLRLKSKNSKTHRYF